MAYLGYSLTYMHCRRVQLYDMSVSNPLVTPVHNGTICVNMENFVEWAHLCFEGYCSCETTFG